MIDGQPMSKKRNYKIIKIGRHYTLGLTTKYKHWEKSARDQLWAQRMTYQSSMTGEFRISSYVEVSFEFFLKDKKKYDLSNLYQGPEDALVKAGILQDDVLIASHDGSRKHLGCENPRVQITIRAFNAASEFVREKC